METKEVERKKSSEWKMAGGTMSVSFTLHAEAVKEKRAAVITIDSMGSLNPTHVLLFLKLSQGLKEKLFS